MNPHPWSVFACPNPDGPAFGPRGQDNLRPHGWSSKARHLRCLRCTVCGKSFSERAGTPLFRTQLPEDKVVQIAHHLVEGTGLRPTSRLCGVSLNTVLRRAREAMPKPSTTSSSVTSTWGRYQRTRPGPLWEKKDKHCDPADPADRQQGSSWDHILLDPESRRIVTLVVDRRTTETARQAFQDFYERTDGCLPEWITTDEDAPYFAVIVRVYGVTKDELDLTEAEKEEFGWDELPAVPFPVEIAYATVPKERQKGRVVRVEPRVLLGTAQQVDEALEHGTTAGTSNTNYVERWIGTQRHFKARTARKVSTFSKELVFPVAVTWLVVVYDNFAWKVRSLREQIQVKPPRYP